MNRMTCSTDSLIRETERASTPAKLYVHVPFCHAKCAYCDFYSTPNAKWMEGYVDAAINEWNSRRLLAIDGVDTVYLGGGTPSSLPLPLLSRLLEALPSENLTEFTIEVNPEDVSDGWVSFIKSETAIDRVSMGIQSFSDEELRAVSRRHTAANAVDAYGRLRQSGIGNISCDLIYGLPGQTRESWRQSVENLLSLRPEHISAYMLSYEEGTRLYAKLISGKLSEADDDTAYGMYVDLCDMLRDAGYYHYEISNFALPGMEAKHNSAYWDGSRYIGIGPGAYSWDGANRSFNPSDIKAYIECGGEDFNIIETETIDNRFNDVVMTSLRTANGLDINKLRRDFGNMYADDLEKELPPLLDSGELTLSADNILTIPESKWFVSNRIILPLIRVD